MLTFVTLALALLGVADAITLQIRQAISAPTPVTNPNPPPAESALPVDPYPYPTIAFANDWPAVYKTGEPIQIDWTGGSGVYDFWTLSLKDNDDRLTDIDYVVTNSTAVSAIYTIASSPPCFREGSSIIFGTQEAGAGVARGDRDHDTSPARRLVRGDNDPVPLC